MWSFLWVDPHAMDQLTKGPEGELMTSVSASFTYPVHTAHTDLEDQFNNLGNFTSLLW